MGGWFGKKIASFSFFFGMSSTQVFLDYTRCPRCFTTTPQKLARKEHEKSTKLKLAWPLHDIAITNIVWCMAYKGGVGGMPYIAQ